MLNKSAVKKLILRNLITPPRWGGKHTELRNIKKSLPNILVSKKKGQKIVKEAIKELVNDGMLLMKPSTGEIHVSLNPRMKKDIMESVK